MNYAKMALRMRPQKRPVSEENISAYDRTLCCPSLYCDPGQLIIAG